MLLKNYWRTKLCFHMWVSKNVKKISKRQAEGIEVAKNNGVRFGRRKYE
ncbi:hypothetical protein SAMN05878482_105176 [Peribacillus simplex]|uniref:Uncharacterized protein n=1 Tax=Peribacillus simplex TaxID=1478 RepID=A0A9X8RB59_9BACI|nr:hypothetical protein SAMN05878482_105176 [Peribacillus simplex]